MTPTSPIKLVDIFSRYPGGRRRQHGENSGEEFFEDYLLPIYKKHIGKHEKLQLDLSGAVGYSSGFLDESFGELSKLFGKNELRKWLVIIANDDPTLEDRVWQKIDAASEHD